MNSLNRGNGVILAKRRSLGYHGGEIALCQIEIRCDQTPVWISIARLHALQRFIDPDVCRDDLYHSCRGFKVWSRRQCSIQVFQAGRFIALPFAAPRAMYIHQGLMPRASSSSPV